MLASECIELVRKEIKFSEVRGRCHAPVMVWIAVLSPVPLSYLLWASCGGEHGDPHPRLRVMQRVCPGCQQLLPQQAWPKIVPSTPPDTSAPLSYGLTMSLLPERLWEPGLPINTHVWRVAWERPWVPSTAPEGKEWGSGGPNPTSLATETFTHMTSANLSSPGPAWPSAYSSCLQPEDWL